MGVRSWGRGAGETGKPSAVRNGTVIDRTDYPTQERFDHGGGGKSRVGIVHRKKDVKK